MGNRNPSLLLPQRVPSAGRDSSSGSNILSHWNIFATLWCKIILYFSDQGFFWTLKCFLVCKQVMENRDLSLPVARAGPRFSWPSSSDCLAQSRPRVTPRPPPVTRCPPAHTHGDTAARLRPSRAWPIHTIQYVEIFLPTTTIKVLWNIFMAQAPGTVGDAE